MSALQVVSRRPEAPSGALLDGLLNGLASAEFAHFAVDLDAAREIWRKYRALVEAPEFPKFLRPFFVEECGGDEPDKGSYDTTVNILDCIELNALSPDSREALLAEHRTFLKSQIDKWKR